MLTEFVNLVGGFLFVQKIVYYHPAGDAVDVWVDGEPLFVEVINGVVTWVDFTHTTPLGPTPADAAITFLHIIT